MIMRAVRGVGLSAALLIQALFVPACSASGRNADTPPLAGSPAAVAIPSSDGWLDHLNFYRAAARLPAVTEKAALSAAARKHAIYIVKNGALQHSEDPGNAWYTPAGQTAARQSNLFASRDTNEPDSRAIDTWMQSPFHAVGLLDPRLVHVGYGSHREERGNLRMAAAMNVMAGLSSTAQATYPIFWPGSATTIPASLNVGAYSGPLAGCPGYTAPSGPPLILQIGPGNLTPVVSATSFTQNGQPLEHCVFDETTYRNTNRSQQKLGRSLLGARDAIVLIPRSPLTAGTNYTASVTANGRAYTWSFGVVGTARAGNGQTFPGNSR